MQPVPNSGATLYCVGAFSAPALGTFASGDNRNIFSNPGGSILATFQTGFYDEYGKPRSECALSDIFGTQKNGNMVGPNGNSSYAHIERNHAILQGFNDSTLLPFAEHSMPLHSISNPVLTVLPPYPAFPPEMVYPRATHTDQPAFVLVERGASRRVFLPGYIDSSYWRSQDPDLSRLLINSIRWMCPDAPMTVTGNGIAEVFAWRTKPGVFRSSSELRKSGTAKRLVQRTISTRATENQDEFTADFKATRVDLLAAGIKIPFTASSNAVEFTVPQIRDYEVVAIS